MDKAISRPETSSVIVGAASLSLITLAPFAVPTACFFIERASHWHSQYLELSSLVAGVIVGAFGVWLWPMKRLWRILLTVPYIVVIAVLSFVYSLWWVCGLFGDCL